MQSDAGLHREEQNLVEQLSSFIPTATAFGFRRECWAGIPLQWVVGHLPSVGSRGRSLEWCELLEASSQQSWSSSRCSWALSPAAGSQLIYCLIQPNQLITATGLSTFGVPSPHTRSVIPTELVLCPWCKMNTPKVHWGLNQLLWSHEWFLCC